MPDFRRILEARLAPLGLDPAREAELIEELSQHLDDTWRDGLAHGLTPSDALDAALEPLKDERAFREALGATGWKTPPQPARAGEPAPPRRMAALVQDIRFGLRLLVRRPGFSAATILTLALGIGANAAIFSVLEAVLLRPLPYPRPEQLVTYWGTSPERGLPVVNMPAGAFAYHRAQATSTLASLAAYETGGQTLSGEGEAERVDAGYVSAGFFETLGQLPRVGRTFRPEEEGPDGPPVVILSDGLWRRRLGADSAILGRTIRLNEVATTVVGIMPPGFDFPDRRQLWLPQRIDPDQFNCWCLSTVGRLRPGRTADSARIELARVSDQFGMARRDIFPDAKPGGTRIVAMPLATSITGNVRLPILVLMGAAGLVLLIVCANIANLLLARTSLRRRELALRVSLGASVGRLASQLLTESFLLALAGMAGGLTLAWSVLRLVRQIPVTLVPRIDQVGLNPSVLLFTVGATLVTGILAGVAPALRTIRMPPHIGLSEGSRGGRSRGGQRMSNLFVTLQLALCLPLLTGAVLLIRSFREIVLTDPGYATEGVVTARVSMPNGKYPSDTVVRQFYDALLERVETMPGVTAAGLAQQVPLTRGNSQANLLAEGEEARGGEPIQVANIRIVSAGYFDAIGTPLLRGRTFIPQDGTGEPVAIVGEAVARRYWPNQNPLGKRIRHGGELPDNPWMTIVGVVPDIRHNSLDENISLQIYQPYGPETTWSMYLVVRSAVPAATLIPAIRAQIAALDPAVPLSETRTMKEAVSESLGTRRLTDVLLTMFALTAALLAAIGIYGVISLNVNGRVREFGVRLALGARPEDVQRLVLRQGLLLALIGVAAGSAGALGLSPLLESLLYGVSPFDLITLGAVVVCLVAITLLACAVPARRAMRADPAEAMRAE